MPARHCVLQLLAPLWVGLEDARHIHARVPMEYRKLASRTAVLCAMLSDPNQCHRQIPVLQQSSQWMKEQSNAQWLSDASALLTTDH
jgi:hypothetical protein